MSRTSNNRRKKRNRKPKPPSPQVQAFAENFARRLNEGVNAMLGRNADGTLSESSRWMLRQMRSIAKNPLE